MPLPTEAAAWLLQAGAVAVAPDRTGTGVWGSLGLSTPTAPAGLTPMNSDHQTIQGQHSTPQVLKIQTQHFRAQPLLPQKCCVKQLSTQQLQIMSWWKLLQQMMRGLLWMTQG